MGLGALLGRYVVVEAVLPFLQSMVSAHEHLIGTREAASDQGIVDVVNGLGLVIDLYMLVDVNLADLFAIDLVDDAHEVLAVVLVRQRVHLALVVLVDVLHCHVLSVVLDGP